MNIKIVFMRKVLRGIEPKVSLVKNYAGRRRKVPKPSKDGCGREKPNFRIEKSFFHYRKVGFSTFLATHNTEMPNGKLTYFTMVASKKKEATKIALRKEGTGT